MLERLLSGACQHGYHAAARCATDGSRRSKLAKLPSKANAMPSQRAVATPCVGQVVRQKATAAAPMDWPSKRDAAKMPLAPPLRFLGALLMSATILGDWKSPKPTPHSHRRQAIL